MQQQTRQIYLSSLVCTSPNSGFSSLRINVTKEEKVEINRTKVGVHVHMLGACHPFFDPVIGLELIQLKQQGLYLEVLYMSFFLQIFVSAVTTVNLYRHTRRESGDTYGAGLRFFLLRGMHSYFPAWQRWHFDSPGVNSHLTCMYQDCKDRI